MTAQLVDSKPQTQSPQVWNKPTAKAQIGDYICAPFVPAMQVVDRDVLSGGQIWLLLKPTTASYTEEWVLEPEADQQPPALSPQTEPQMQPSGLSGDSVACQLRSLEVAPQPEAPAPQPTALAEKEQGRQHGQNDTLAGWHPIYTQALTEYATGCLAGYNAVLNLTDQQPEISKSLEWLVCLDPQWGLYQVWVGDRCVGHSATYEQAECKAQAYIATEETIHCQNRAVMAAYAAI